MIVVCFTFEVFHILLKGLHELRINMFQFDNLVYIYKVYPI